jgi:hypothetical protein
MTSSSCGRGRPGPRIVFWGAHPGVGNWARPAKVADLDFPIGKNCMIEDSSQFGAAVASARKALGLTQRKLALAINSGQRFIVD